MLCGDAGRTSDAIRLTSYIQHCRLWAKAETSKKGQRAQTHHGVWIRGWVDCLAMAKTILKAWHEGYRTRWDHWCTRFIKLKDQDQVYQPAREKQVELDARRVTYATWGTLSKGRLYWRQHTHREGCCKGLPPALEKPLPHPQKKSHWWITNLRP